MKLITYFKPLIRHIAEHADIKLNHPWTALGQHPILFEDSYEIYKNNIPKSVMFNTRSGKIIIGANTVFGENVMLLTGKHEFLSNITDISQLHKVPENGRDIIIGRNCYIGGGAIIIGGVSIGDYAVIAAGAVVTKNVPEKTLNCGVPAKVIKEF